MEPASHCWTDTMDPSRVSYLDLYQCFYIYKPQVDARYLYCMNSICMRLNFKPCNAHQLSLNDVNPQCNRMCHCPFTESSSFTCSVFLCRSFLFFCTVCSSFFSFHLQPIDVIAPPRHFSAFLFQSSISSHHLTSSSLLHPFLLFPTLK